MLAEMQKNKILLNYRLLLLLLSCTSAKLISDLKKITKECQNCRRPINFNGITWVTVMQQTGLWQKESSCKEKKQRNTFLVDYFAT